MTTYDITAPEPQFSGEVAGVNFSQGTATLDSRHEHAAAALAYFGRRGYGINGGEPTAERHVPFEPADPRDYPPVEGGSLRDGAVEPRATDAGLPTTAGIDNPHGPRVVSPEAPTPPGQIIETEPAVVDGEQAAGRRPSRNASKAEWVAYADKQDEQVDHSSMTKEELVARYGGGS